jgi:hypothetical protein
MPPSSGISGNISTDLYYGCSKVWQFNALFHADGDQRAKTCLDTNRPASVCKIGTVRHLLESHLNTKNRPSSIGYIELRYLRSDVVVCVAHATAKTPLPPIPFEGFIQSSKNSLSSDCLNAWFNARWTPVRGKLGAAFAAVVTCAGAAGEALAAVATD